MATFVIVHGSWGGGWEWEGVAERLTGMGHEVATPTLTGVGEATHGDSSSVGLETHVEDVIGAIGASDVLLVGHSYGGAVATVVASRVPGRFRGLIYIDGFIPSDGQSVADLVDPEWAESAFFAPARAVGGGWRVPFPFPEELEDYPPDVAERYRAGWQPLATLTEPASVGPAIATVPRVFVHCIRKEPGTDAFVDATRTAS